MTPQELQHRPHRPGWQHWFRPIASPPADSFEVTSPIRDDTRLGPTEDLDRGPDGVPHAVVGLTAYFSVILALLVLSMFFIGSTLGMIGGVLLVILAVPVMVSKLNKKSRRDRDHRHPSR
ncbi:MAG: hypothetical protein ABI467_27095 [Kofleriaceae bacterium]